MTHRHGRCDYPREDRRERDDPILYWRALAGVNDSLHTELQAAMRELITRVGPGMVAAALLEAASRRSPTKRGRNAEARAERRRGLPQ